MIIRKLNWAGALLESKQVRILIDPVFKSPDISFFGNPLEPFSDLEDIENVDLILITHLHSDHFDPYYIQHRFGPNILLLIPNGTGTVVKSMGFKNVKEMSIAEEIFFKGTRVIASHSADGLGDNQVSWIIQDREKTVLHSGDTLWHGHWWGMAKKYGPFDATLLPVNGAVIHDPGQINTDQPICLNPEQAVSAAKILESKLLIPIHYGAFHHPPIYRETNQVKERLHAATMENNVNVKILSIQEETII